MNPSEQLQNIEQTFALFASPLGVTEIRSPKIGKFNQTASGLFEASAAAAFVDGVRQIAQMKPTAIYTLINPANPALLARAANRVQFPAATTTSDADIVRRVWILSDMDVTRPAGISATDDEHDDALTRATACRDFLRDTFGAASVLADSGNGGHCLLPVDLPNDEDALRLVTGVLAGLAARFDDDAVHVDQSVFNAARISKLYGSEVRKGDNLPIRPHRYSRLLDVPSDLPPVSLETLQAIAALAPAAAKPNPAPSASASTSTSTGYTKTQGDRFDVIGFMQQHGLTVHHEKDWGHWHKWVLEECPFDASHRAPDAMISQEAGGALKFRCLHASCKANDWKTLRQKMQPGWTPYDPNRRFAPNATKSAGRSQTHRKASAEPGTGTEPQDGEEAQEADAEVQEAGSGLPTIETNGIPLREMSDAALAALIEANNPPQTFIRGGKLVRVACDEDGVPSVQQMNLDMLRGVLARVGEFVSTSNARGEVPVSPPQNVVADILSLPAWPELPPIAGVVTAPVFASDGTLCAEPGYHPANRFYYHQAEGFTLPDTTPTPDNVKAALLLLREDLLGDFPFADAASEANALGLMLLPFVRYMITSATPLHLINSPAAGTGKGLLADACSLAFLPTGLPIMTAPTKDEEWEKKLLACLLPAPSHILIDNCRVLDSPHLDAALTAPDRWTGRILGLSENGTVPVRCAWIATANNLQAKGDLLRRLIMINIDSRVEKPYQRTGFRHKNLRAWIKANRAALVGACLTLVRAWQAAGSPDYAGTAEKGSYESWLAVIGGILETVGITDFLANEAQAETEVDPETQAWRAFLEDWHTRRAAEKEADNRITMECTAAEILVYAEDYLMEDLGEKEGKARTMRMGRLLNERKGRIFGEYRIKRTGTAHKTGLYLVEKTDNEQKGGYGGYGGTAGAARKGVYENANSQEEKKENETPVCSGAGNPPNTPYPPADADAPDSALSVDILAMIESARAGKLPTGEILLHTPNEVCHDLNMRVKVAAGNYKRDTAAGKEADAERHLEMLRRCLEAWQWYMNDDPEEMF